MSKIFSEDVYCLGLLYSYLYAGKQMVLKDDLEAFYQVIEKNLENIDVLDLYATTRHDNDQCIFYSSEGKNGEVYYVLNSDFDINKAKVKYIDRLSITILVASQEDSALECLGLQLKNGHICKKEKYNIGIVGGPTYINQLIDKIRSGELKIEDCSKVEVNSDFTKDIIIEHLNDYQKKLEKENKQVIKVKNNNLFF